jgi:hypothetical protein
MLYNIKRYGDELIKYASDTLKNNENFMLNVNLFMPDKLTEKLTKINTNYQLNILGKNFDQFPGLNTFDNLYDNNLLM